MYLYFLAAKQPNFEAHVYEKMRIDIISRNHVIGNTN